MKVIKNNFFRLIMFIFGFAGILMLLVGSLVTFATYDYMGAEKAVTPYLESEAVRKNVYNTAVSLNAEAQRTTKINELNLDDNKVTVYDYADDISKEYTFKDLLDAENVAVRLRNSLYDSQSSYYALDTNSAAYKEIPANTTGKIVKISLSEYLKLIVTNGTKYYGDSSQDGYEIFNIITDLMENGENFTDGGNIFYIKTDKSYVIYDETNKFIYRTGNLFPNGHQDLERITSDYVYFADNDYKDFKDMLPEFMYCSVEEALYGTLSSEEKEGLETIGYYPDHYMNGVNAVFSLGNDTITDCFIDDDEISSKLYQATDKAYNSTYSELRDEIVNTADVFVSYDSKTKKINQWYKGENDIKKNYEYLSERDILSLTDGIDYDFTIGLKIYDNQYYNFERTMYSFCLKVPEPVILMALGTIFFLLAVVLLTIGEPAKIEFFDKLPYLVHIALLILLCGAISSIFYTMGTFNDQVADIMLKETTGFIMFLVIIAAVTYIICAACYLSLIRRIKCKKFLDGFITIKICRWLIKKVRTALSYLKGRTKLTMFIIAAFLAVMFLTIIVMAAAQNDAAGLGAFLIFLIFVAVALFVLRYMIDIERILEASKKIESGDLDAKVDTEKLTFNNKELGESFNNLGTGLSKAVEASVRDERTKAELITNVSHDIKTPLTSIINYVDLLKRENIDNPKAQEYIEVLDKKSDRLKQLILDLIEASKTSTGNIELEKTDMNLVELVGQAVGEYEDKFNEKNLELVQNITVNRALINADGRRIFRVIDNVLGNVYKYSMPGTRVYLNLGISGNEKDVIFSLKNVSKEMLNISADELTERFVRGDKSRSTEGSGLGLSIAKNLIEMHDGTFKINIDGDMFTVIISLPLVEEKIPVSADEESAPVTEENTEPVTEEESVDNSEK
ncbi:MAG: GHKL domain-containing protein [Eubacterium sp.]|nr:GHKL domain-containing protein [Eubacterium sp.]